MSQHGFGDLLSHAHDGVECGHGLLEDHGHARAAELAHGIVVERARCVRLRVVGEYDFALDSGLWWEKPHDGQRGHGFSRAGFAYQAQHFAASDGEA